MKPVMAGVQRVGAALMLPIAVLPIAGLLLRLGQPDLLNVAFISAAGDAIFANLGLLFAVGVAVGLARENHGAAGLAAVVGYLVTTKGAEVLISVPPEVLSGLTGQARDLASTAYKSHELAKLSVPAGILSGLIAGALYNRFSTIQLPSYLAFFGGRRFVPIASGFAGLALAALFGWEWQHLEQGMDVLSRSVVHAGAFGLFAYGVLNRILIVTGLHHIINNIAWFLLGDYNGVTGDMKRFFAGDASAGAFMAGFFPVMMFGLPGACLAMYHAALPARRAAVSGLLLSIALTSVLTGVTEPIEFTFMFLAPALYAVHAVLTGIAFVIMNALQVRLGFGFSAGLFDYALNFNKATRPLLLIPVGLVYFALYYGLFRLVIVKFNLKTPGREADSAAVTEDAPLARPGGRAMAFIDALGGRGNIASLDACTTRLRLRLADPAAVDADALTRLGSRGLVRPSADTLQIVVGPIADQIAAEIKTALRDPQPAARVARTRPEPATTAAAGPGAGPIAPANSAPALAATTVASLLAALGGRTNVRAVEAVSSRLRIQIADAGAVNRGAIGSLGLRGFALPNPHWVHVVIGPAAPATGRALQELLLQV
jgi:N-acetylglucosamine PTS system EIICBA or EIICB component